MAVRKHNFTLLELIVTVMIMALLIGVAVSSLSRTPVFMSLRQIAGDVKLACASMRQTASFQNKTMTVSYDPESRLLTAEDTAIEIPEDMKIVLAGTDITRENEKRELFRLFPDGSGEGQEIELAWGEDKLVLTLSPLTGRILIRNEQTN